MITITMPIWASWMWYASWYVTASVAVVKLVREILNQRRIRAYHRKYLVEYQARPAGAKWPLPGPDSE